MAIFGDNSIVGHASNSEVANYKYACRFELIEDGTVSKITSYNSSASGTRAMIAGIYSDNAGAPDALKGTTDVTSITTTAAWRDFNFAVAVSLTAGFYWLTVLCGQVYNVWQMAGAVNQQADCSDTYVGGFADPFDGATLTYYDNTQSIYATYTPTVPPSGVRHLFYPVTRHMNRRTGRSRAWQYR